MQVRAYNLRQRSDREKGNPNLEVGHYVSTVVLNQRRRRVPYGQGETAGT